MRTTPPMDTKEVLTFRYEPEVDTPGIVILRFIKHGAWWALRHPFRAVGVLVLLTTIGIPIARLVWPTHTTSTVGGSDKFVRTSVPTPTSPKLPWLFQTNEQLIVGKVPPSARFATAEACMSHVHDIYGNKLALMQRMLSKSSVQKSELRWDWTVPNGASGGDHYAAWCEEAK